MGLRKQEARAASMSRSALKLPLGGSWLPGYLTDHVALAAVHCLQCPCGGGEGKALGFAADTSVCMWGYLSPSQKCCPALAWEEHGGVKLLRFGVDGGFETVRAAECLNIPKGQLLAKPQTWQRMLPW